MWCGGGDAGGDAGGECVCVCLCVCWGEVGDNKCSMQSVPLTTQ